MTSQAELLTLKSYSFQFFELIARYEKILAKSQSQQLEIFKENQVSETTTRKNKNNEISELSTLNNKPKLNFRVANSE